LVRFASGIRWGHAAASNGSIGCDRWGDGVGWVLGTGFVFILSNTPTRLERIKQLSQAKKGTTVNRWVVGGPNRRADDFIEHPTRDAPSRPVREHHVNQITLTTRTAKNLQFLAEQGMVRVEDFCRFGKPHSVDCAVSGTAKNPARRTPGS